MRADRAQLGRRIGRHALEFIKALPDRVLTHLKILAGDTGGYAVDRLTHSLQTATRAQHDGQGDPIRYPARCRGDDRTTPAP